MKCVQKTCDNEATTAFYWPGHSTQRGWENWHPVCESCARGAKIIGAEMGMGVPTSNWELKRLEQLAAREVIEHVKKSRE